MTTEEKKFIKDLFEEQNWLDEEFDETTLDTVSGIAYWLEYTFDMYEVDTEDKKYSKAIKLLIRELERR